MLGIFRKSEKSYWQYHIAGMKSSRNGLGTSLAVQRLRLRASTAGGVGLIPGRGAKIPHATRHSQKKKKEMDWMVKLKNSLRKMRKGQENWSRDVKKNRGGTRVQDVHPPDNEIQKEKKKNVGGKNYQRNHSRLCLNTILQMEKAQSAQNTG